MLGALGCHLTISVQSTSAPGLSLYFTDMADDFSEPAKRALASRVGNLCSSPECRALTSGPQEDPAKALNIGVATPHHRRVSRRPSL